MKILILNWRDSKNPESGGAELLTHEMAKRWVVAGHTVVQFSSRFPGGNSEEVIDGVRIIRRGASRVLSGGFPVHLAAFWWYLRHGKGRFDVVLDEVHGIPFFTPLYVKERKVALLCEVAHEIWDINFRFPLNLIGKIVERLYFYFYKDITFLTISPSTKHDVVAMGHDEQLTVVLPMGLSLPKLLVRFPKEKRPTLIFVGRLVKSKGIEDALETIARLKKEFPTLQLWIIGQGDGSYVAYLKRKAKELSVGGMVKFWGFVEERQKFELLSRSHVFLNPSVREGWGLTVPEAGAVGTPAVAYRVPGLQDIIHSGRDGILVDRDVDQMYRAVRLLLNNQRTYHRLQKGAIALSKFSWDKTAEVALAVLRQRS